MNQKNIIAILLVIIAVLGGALGFMIFSQKAMAPGENSEKIENVSKNAEIVGTNQNMAQPEKPPVSVDQPIEQAQTKIVNENVYKNTEYGFQITIPQGYNDWKAMIEKDYGGPGVSYIYINFKTSDPNFKIGVENFVTHEKFPEYANVFAFTAWTKNAYAKAEKECKNNPMPGCPEAIIGENAKYIFDASLGNGVPPKDLEALRKELGSADSIGKALEFKAF